MRKQKDIKFIIHPPMPENILKLNNTLSSEYARLIKALLYEAPKKNDD